MTAEPTIDYDDLSPPAKTRLAIMELLDEGLIEVSGYTEAGDPLYVAVER